MKVLLKLSTLIFLLSACTRSENGSDMVMAYPTQALERPVVLSPEQQSAFDALNTLQLSTDERDRLYSAFAGITPPCNPPDSSLIISQLDLLIAMQQFVNRHCKNLPIEKRDSLAAASILAQKEYILTLCLVNSDEATYENGPPMEGTWILPNVLGRRDVIMVW